MTAPISAHQFGVQGSAPEVDSVTPRHATLSFAGWIEVVRHLGRTRAGLSVLVRVSHAHLRLPPEPESLAHDSSVTSNIIIDNHGRNHAGIFARTRQNSLSRVTKLTVQGHEARSFDAIKIFLFRHA